jgi:hypothetical protein
VEAEVSHHVHGVAVDDLDEVGVVFEHGRQPAWME